VTGRKLSGRDGDTSLPRLDRLAWKRALVAGLFGMAGIAVPVILVGRKAAALPAARGAVGTWVLGTLASAEELVALGADEWALAQLAERERGLAARTRTVAAATGLGRAASMLAGGQLLACVSRVGRSYDHRRRGRSRVLDVFSG
jgi:hypothetical protein